MDRILLKNITKILVEDDICYAKSTNRCLFHNKRKST